MTPIRVRRVASAIAPSSVQPSRIGPPVPRPPMVAKWSKTQQWSKPASSAIRQTSRSSATVVHCGECLRPTRTGWRGLRTGQPPEDRQVGGVRPVAVQTRYLLDEGQTGQPGIVEERAEPALADLALPDVGVAVTVGAQPGHGVVRVDRLHPGKPDDAVELVDRPPRALRGPDVVAGGERVAGVEADRRPRVAERRQHLGDLLEAGADAAAQPGVVLDQELGLLGVGPLQDALQVLGDLGQAGLEAGALVTAGVE